MRLATLSSLVLLVGCGPGIDPLIGSFTFTMSGSDVNTAPDTNSSTATGAGTVAITSNGLTTGYVVTVAQSDLTPCVFAGTTAEKATDPQITITSGQTCALGSATATLTAAKAVLKMNATRAADVITVDVSYSYAGKYPIFNTNYTGNGHRVYTGTRR